MGNLLSIRGVSKSYVREDQHISVLRDINLEVNTGDFVSLMGPSGSGKTTLLNIAGGIDSPTSGHVVMNDVDISGLGDTDLSKWRTTNVGFVFQQYNLLPVLTALENVELPLFLLDMSQDERRRRAMTALTIVGLEHRAHHYPRQMSGGEEQRTAMARALVTDPRLIIADEPTGNLDAAAAANVLDLLQSLNTDFGKTVLMVTHDPSAAARAKRCVRLNKGTLEAHTAEKGRAQ